MGLAYEMKSLATGQRLGLHASDLENLLALAYRYGWRSEAGSEGRLHDLERVVVPAQEVLALADVLQKALAHLPRERRKEIRPESGGSAVDKARSRASIDPKDYFAWKRRWMVEEVAMLCGRGSVEIRPM